jgi:hypothetical protein
VGTDEPSPCFHEQVASIGQEQAASIQQTSTFIEEIQELSKKLNEFANQL